ncbi:MAG: hypothetical protein IJ574_04120 [Bacilli bacterium]|nr:hypothetical protein [Bacilli bacterium]
MKKVLITILVAVLVGSLFAVYVFKNIEEGIALTTSNNEVTAFQVGVFSNYDNALKQANNFKSSIVVHDDNYYRVFIAMYHDEKIIKLMQDYYQDISIYLKRISVSDEFLTKLAKYESLINTSKLDNYDEVNQSILNEYNKTK